MKWILELGKLPPQNLRGKLVKIPPYVVCDDVGKPFNVLEFGYSKIEFFKKYNLSEIHVVKINSEPVNWSEFCDVFETISCHDNS